MSLDLKDLGTDIVGPVCALLRHTGRVDTTFVGSDGDDQIIEMRRQCPDVHTTYNLADVTAMRVAAATNDATFVAPALVDQPPYRINNGTHTVTAATIAYAHAHDLAVMTWVIDDEPTMRVLVDLGVDGIYTRKPSLLAKIVKQHAMRIRQTTSSRSSIDRRSSIERAEIPGRRDGDADTEDEVELSVAER